MNRRVRALMLQGTGSHAGKTVLVAGLCRLLTRRGFRVVIAGGAESRAEGFAVRRTRVLLLPADDL